jgi:protein-S-isoprenylcysteine O-methyltransferase Ste14
VALRLRFGLVSERELDAGSAVGEIPVFWTLSIVLCVVGAWFTGGQSRLSVMLASPLLLLGGLSALWAIRVLGKGRQLVTWGPYAFVRHPYFLSVLVMVVGAIAALRSWPGLILLIPAVKVTVDRARREEHNLGIRYGDEYVDYQRQVPFLLPWPGGGATPPSPSTD